MPNVFDQFGDEPASQPLEDGRWDNVFGVITQEGAYTLFHLALYLDGNLYTANHRVITSDIARFKNHYQIVLDTMVSNLEDASGRGSKNTP